MPAPTTLTDTSSVPVGTAGNPLVVSGSVTATNPSVGTTGATAPTSATELGIISGSNIVGVSASNPLPNINTAGEAHMGQVGGTTPRIAPTYTSPQPGAVAYTVGDLIGNSTTAASVVPITFSSVARISGGSGRITGCRCVLTAASGTNVVLPSFDLLLFRPATNIPLTAGSYPADNAALNISSAAMIQLLVAFSFVSTAWRNQAGGNSAAGLNVWQTVAVPTRVYAPFNLASVSSADLLGLMQAQSAWAPGAISQQFDFALDVDQD